jgi:hypothetical protein
MSCSSKDGATTLLCDFTPSEPDMVPTTPNILTPSRMLEGINLDYSAGAIDTLPEPS